MLFNSNGFLFAYLPITLLIFFAVGGRNRTFAALWLVIASVFFYGWWNPKFVSLLLASVTLNYLAGRMIVRRVGRASGKKILIGAVSANLILLGLFKYTNFFIATVNDVAGTDLPLTSIILPLGISFFTFTQIAYLVDAYHGRAKGYDFLHYLLFVTYFPHLIAGPIYHHRQMMPQFTAASMYRLSSTNIAIGLAVFTIGLGKKVLLADNFAEYATPVFNEANQGTSLKFFAAWTGVLAYTFQLYFDFSGYSDMAIGLAKMMGITLPVNFNSPYKAPNIIEFWRRWHMTLSRFLRDYLYILLGGNRRGSLRKYVNLMTTMILGGLWHGANWTFVVWGALHGAYLLCNHAWIAVRKQMFAHTESSPSTRYLGIVITFVAVAVAWVFFRAENFASALVILEGMSGLRGVTLPRVFSEVLDLPIGSSISKFLVFDGLFPEIALSPARWCILAVTGAAITWLMPNSIYIQERVERILRSGVRPASSPTGIHFINQGHVLGLIFGILFGLALLGMQSTGEFLYFQF